jgi:hypothetical protein
VFAVESIGAVVVAVVRCDRRGLSLAEGHSFCEMGDFGRDDWALLELYILVRVEADGLRRKA